MHRLEGSGVERTTVRVEALSDRAAVDALVEEAFGDPRVARLVQLIRASDYWIPDLSLVAERDGTLVGHVLLSRTELIAEEGSKRHVLLLSPLAVLPAAQGRGIARLLVESALAAAGRTDMGLVLLEGDPRLYERFGFDAATPMGIERPSNLIPEVAWQGYRLPAWDAGLRGRVTYPSAFWETGSVGP